MGFITYSQFSSGLTAAKNYIDEKNTDVDERVTATEQRVTASETAIAGCYTKQETDAKIDTALGDINTLLSSI